MNFDLLKEILCLVKVKEDDKEISVIRMSESFVIRDRTHAADLIKRLDSLVLDLCIMSKKGYVNDPKANLPVVLTIVKELKIVDDNDEEKKFNASVLMNTLYYNLVLLALLTLVINIEIFNDLQGTLNEDQLVDLKNVRRSIVRMIHPNINRRIKKKGITIILNSIAGFDSEYEVESSIDMSNKLLSIQIASDSNMYVKIPLSIYQPFYSSSIKIVGYENVNV
jgi:hypothetical protein